MMRDLPNFNHLYYFWTIAHEGSIKKASQKLHLSQPGLSVQLKSLETRFGKRLFDRKVRKLVLNGAGRVVLDYCNRIFGLADEMDLNMKQPWPMKKILVRVGVLPSLSSTHVHDFVVPLWNDKSVSVSVLEGSLDELIYQLDNNNLEIVLSDREVEKKYKKLTSHRLQPRKIVAVGTQKFIAVKKEFPRSLTNVPMIYLTRHSQIRIEIDRYFFENDINPQIIGEADDVALLRLGAEKGFCVSVLPENAVSEAIAEKRLIKLGDLKGVRSDMWAMTRMDTVHESVIQKTIRRFLAKK